MLCFSRIYGNCLACGTVARYLDLLEVPGRARPFIVLIRAIADVATLSSTPGVSIILVLLHTLLIMQGNDRSANSLKALSCNLCQRTTAKSSSQLAIKQATNYTLFHVNVLCKLVGISRYLIINHQNFSFTINRPFLITVFPSIHETVSTISEI